MDVSPYKDHYYELHPWVDIAGRNAFLEFLHQAIDRFILGVVGDTEAHTRGNVVAVVFPAGNCDIGDERPSLIIVEPVMQRSPEDQE